MRAREADTEGFVEHDGVKIHYEVHGDGGPTILLLPTWTIVHKQTWKMQIAYLARHHRVVVYDGPGNGRSDRPLEAEPYAQAAQVGYALAVLDATGTDRAVMAGLSRAANWALELAAEHPDRVRSLSLLAPGGTVAKPEVMDQIVTSTLAAVENSDPIGTRRRIEWLMAHPETSVTDELVAIRHAIYQQPEMKQNVGNILVLQDMEVRTQNLMTEDRLGRIQAPTLVVWTAEDPTSTVAEGHFWANSIPGARFEMIEEAGHWPHYEQPERFNALHLEFLRSTLD